MAKRKSLSCGKEEFFTAMVLLWGNPERDPFEFMGKVFGGNPTSIAWYGGVQGWCKASAEGMDWSYYVASYGEAKTRAFMLYIEFLAWFERHNPELANIREEPHPVAKKEWMFFEQLRADQ